MANREANVNTLVSRDCFAQVVPLFTDDMLREIKLYFGAYASADCYPAVKDYEFNSL